MSAEQFPYRAPAAAAASAPTPASHRIQTRTGARRLLAYPELLAVLAVAGVLNLWNLSENGYANTFYAAAVKSMAGSWHDFLFASMDRAGLMTIDKPPLAYWIQALVVRVFGYSSWSLLVPQAIMGVIAAALMYDLTRRRFGRAAGFAAGLALATTPTIVAVSRHNNPDELLVMLSVAAVWFTLRALDTGRTRHLVWAGVMVGLGFETKMGVALMLVPAIAAAWLWMRWGRDGAGLRGNVRMAGQLLWGGLAMAAVGLAWPLLVTLTPAADRPWISGTSDNSIWSLIVSYNGLGRIDGQTGGPGGGGGGGFGGGGGGGGGAGSVFGGNTGIFRLLQSGLGDQAGWLLGFALVAAAGLVVLTRLRRHDPRTGFVIVLGGTLLTVGVVFSFASGIFHPYYVSMVAPWAAALIGAGVGEMLPRPIGVASGTRSARILGPAALLGGTVTELVVLGNLNGQLSWAKPLVIGAGIGGAVLLTAAMSPRLRVALVAVACAALLAAPVTWAAETLSHPANGTFPTGGPSTAEVGGSGGPGGVGGFGGRGFARHRPGGFTPPSGAAGGPPGAVAGAPPAAGSGGAASSPFGRGPAARGGGGFAGGFGGNSSSLLAAARYARAHGGGTVAVDSQSSAAQAVMAGATNVAGIGGFSGRESTVTARWLAMEIREGRLRWLLSGGTGGAQTVPGDTRTGSAGAISIAERVARKVTFKSGGQTVTLYDLQGRAAAILAAAAANA